VPFEVRKWNINSVIISLIMDWIKTKDRLPEPHKEGYWFHGVIAFYEMPDGSKHTELVQWCKNNLFVFHGMNITAYVTHWMEAPKPPKE